MFSRMRVAAPSTYHPLFPSGTPPLLPILLPAPSTSHRADIPEVDTPPRKRLLLTAPRPGCEVGEAAGSCCENSQTHYGPTIVQLGELRLSIEEERTYFTSKRAHRHEWQRQDADDRATRHIMRIQALEAGAKKGRKEKRRGVAAAMSGSRSASRGRNGYDTAMVSGPSASTSFRECSYSEFRKCKPLDFKGTEGDVRLSRWFEKMEYVFSISNYTASCQVKFTTCTLKDDATLHGGIAPNQKIETEMWNLKVKGTDVVAYNRRFQQLALMCARMFLEEVDKIEKYIGGLPDMILGSVKASKPKTMQEAIEFTTELMDEKTHAYAERQEEKKRKYDDLSKNNQNQQQQNKRQNTGQAYTAGKVTRKPYDGSKPLFPIVIINHRRTLSTKVHNSKSLASVQGFNKPTSNA
ncbi:hypothetical protein Tco_0756660 [Tanacetum coccineum]